MAESEQTSPAGHVFLSYSRDDQAVALPIISALEGAGISVWWDGLIEGGAKFGSITEDALEGAAAVIVLWSRTSTGSHWVKDEATRGRDRGRLIPVSIDGSEPPLGFRQFQCLDLPPGAAKPGNAQFERLVNSIRSVESGAKPATLGFMKPAASGGFSISRRGALIGSGVAAMAAGGGVWWLGGFGTGRQAGSVVVLPFKALGGDSEQRYFAEGLAAEVRARLARNPLLKVSAETSSSAVRASGQDAKSISSKLGVAYLLDGNVRRIGNQIRVVAELIDGATGFSTWSLTYDKLLDDVFEIQRAIAAAVTQALSAEMDGGGSALDEQKQVGSTQSVAAYEAYLRGRELYDAGIDENSDRQALAKFEEAISIDGNYAAAHAGRSRSLGIINNLYSKPDERDTLYKLAVGAAEKAVEIAPEFADGYSVLGFTLANGGLNMAAARAPYQKSFELGSGDADVLSRFAIFCSRVGDNAAASKAIESSAALDPLNARTFRSVGDIAYGARDYPAAKAAFDKAKTIQEGLSSYHYSVGLVHLATGNLDAARQSFIAESRATWSHTGGAIAEYRLGNQTAAQEHLALLKAANGDSSNYQYAQILGQWGRQEDAMAALIAAWKLRDAGLVQMYNDPLLDPIRNAAAFTDLAAKIGFQM